MSHNRVEFYIYPPFYIPNNINKAHHLQNSYFSKKDYFNHKPQYMNCFKVSFNLQLTMPKES